MKIQVLLNSSLLSSIGMVCNNPFYELFLYGIQYPVKACHEISIKQLHSVILHLFSNKFYRQARSQGGGVRGPPLENQRSTFWNLAREIIKANNYKWLTIYLHQLLCTKPPTKWLQNLLSKGGSGGANL